jgi:hypothetical protein
MAIFSQPLQELAQYDRRIVECQARIARQAEFVRELDADGHDTTFGAKRLVVMMTNLTHMEIRRQQILRELSASQRDLAA